MQIYDTIIIGSGPAAYTASIYLRDANYNVLVLEGFNAGGYPPGGRLSSQAHCSALCWCNCRSAQRRQSRPSGI